MRGNQFEANVHRIFGEVTRCAAHLGIAVSTIHDYLNAGTINDRQLRRLVYRKHVDIGLIKEMLEGVRDLPDDIKRVDEERQRAAEERESA